MLADAVGGDPIRYADAVVVASTGKIYFSDASTRFAPSLWGGTSKRACSTLWNSHQPAASSSTTRPAKASES